MITAKHFSTFQNLKKKRNLKKNIKFALIPEMVRERANQMKFGDQHETDENLGITCLIMSDMTKLFKIFFFL